MKLHPEWEEIGRFIAHGGPYAGALQGKPITKTTVIRNKKTRIIGICQNFHHETTTLDSMRMALTPDEAEALKNLLEEADASKENHDAS